MKDEQIFHQALEQPADRRASFLDAACAGDADLRQRVEVLLGAHANPGSFLESPAHGIDVSPTIDQPITEKPGTVIDRYKLLEQIGEGGFGVVFMAEQEEPVRRKVALKIIKPGMDTKEVIARFEAERQALAIMDHPNIAKVLDAGATESGRPYFVMELVRGIPITDFCDQNSLSTRERLELFASVCQAVQHAHQKGIIHRDIKPSNVMVTLRDDVPVAKVIDFGVAKATNARLTEQSFFTRFGQMIGTPLYMSPEQAGMSELDVDTRSDIYSLGVLLYELLTDATPFDQQRIREAAYDELLKIIREEEPPKPSLRISSLGETLPSVAAQRKLEPKKLSALVRGELDWIVMKALEKDRTRRYETANGLAADIQCYLDDEPVQACPPSAAYRFKKFARRNKAALVTVAILGAALLVATWQSIRATNERNRAVIAEAALQRADILGRLSGVHAEQGRFLEQQNQLDDALDSFTKQWDAASEYAALDSYLPGFYGPTEQIRALTNLLRICRDQARWAEGLKYWEPLRDVVESLPPDAFQRPGHENVEAAFWPALNELGRIDLGMGSDAETANLATEVKQLVARFPLDEMTDGHSLDNLAWGLATNPSPRLRDPALACRLIQRAVEGDPERGNFARNHGIARYRNVEFELAIAELERALTLGHKNSYNWFFLAMAYKQMGNEEQSRSNFELAIDWMDEREPNSEALIRFRAEAAQLLGIPAEAKVQQAQ